MADAINRYENEQRAIDYVTLDRAKAGEIAPPTPEVLAKYFEDHKDQFRAPEYRSVVLLSVTPSDIAKPSEVSDADARRYYDANASRFGSPERRELQQIVFPKLEDAQAAAARLGNEFSFEALAKERGLSEKDLDLGMVTKSGMIDRAVADAAFSLKEGETSAPVKGMFGTTLVHVVKIEPSNMKPFEQVEPEIKQTIAVDRARDDIATRHDKIEDERAGGARLTEIAQKFGLTARTIDAVDRQGRDPDGNPVSGLPAGVDVVAQAFGSDVGVDNEPLQLTGGGYVWYDVTGVKPSHDRTLDEVRPRVEEAWRNDQVAERLKAKAAEMVDKLKGGTSLNDLAAADGLTVQTTFGLKRANNTATSVSARVVEAVFQSVKDAYGSAEGSDPSQWIVFHLTDISVPTFNAASAEGKRIDDTLRQSLNADIQAQYLERLKTDLGATINQNAVRQVSSGGNATDEN